MSIFCSNNKKTLHLKICFWKLKTRFAFKKCKAVTSWKTHPIIKPVALPGHKNPQPKDITTEFLTHLEQFKDVNKLKSLLIYLGLYTSLETQLVVNYKQWFKSYFISFDLQSLALFLIFNKISKIPLDLCFIITVHQVTRQKAETPLGPGEGAGRLAEWCMVFLSSNSKEGTGIHEVGWPCPLPL